ncbi:MAG: type II toxin-antitoxin system VapC family toxin [Acidimicrobiales bacterium]
MGVTVLDAGVLIGFLDANDMHHEAAKDALEAARAAGSQIAMPASAFAESLVGPARRGTEAVGAVQELIKRLPIDVIALDESIALAAAELRARHGGRLKLPDALVVATAQVLDVDALVTTDKDWPSRSKLRLRAKLIQL